MQNCKDRHTCNAHPQARYFQSCFGICNAENRIRGRLCHAVFLANQHYNTARNLSCVIPKTSGFVLQRFQLDVWGGDVYTEDKKTVKFYTRQKRELSEWMQSVKFEDIKSNPKENSWMQDKIGKTLGRKLMGEQEYLKYQEGVRKELAMREGWNHKSAADRKKKRKGEPGGLDLGPQTIVKMTDM